MKNPKARTLHDFVEELGRKNLTASDWAQQHGFDRQDVYMVLRGRTHGRRGKARAVLQAMGVQPPPLIRVRNPMTPTTACRPPSSTAHARPPSRSSSTDPAG